MKKHVIAYLHSHWDREWYREFEVFRLRLLRVFDNILELLSMNKIPSFYFDGQVSALEDYLEMRPENRELVETFIHHKRLFIGPFYCLIDEFLTDRKCFEKNLEIGIKIAKKYGCEDFIGYLPDTFGHSQNVPEILMDYGIDKCIVWRGCGDFPSEFKWCGIDTVNLVRGYFNDIFSMNTDIDKKADILKKQLDLISEKSGEYILLPIGADHLGVETDITEQIATINTILKDDYYITLGSPFDYFRRVEDNYSNFEWNDELRDNSKTFTLQGCYSSRIDLKTLNTECMYKLELVSKFTDFLKETKYDNIIEYAYKMLIQNQAHDSICGCSIDNVHLENKVRYKKILQIADGIIAELKLKNDFKQKRILNLSDQPFSGVIEFETSEQESGYDLIGTRKGFDTYLLADTQRIPVTEDYGPIYRYAAEVENVTSQEIEFIMQALTESDLSVSKDSIENTNISLKIIDNNIYINGRKMVLTDFVELGDSYNHGPSAKDNGVNYEIMKTRIVLDTPTRAVLKMEYEGSWDVISLYATLDKHSKHINLTFDWENTKKNHLLCAGFEMDNPITSVYSEDMNVLIKRTFDSYYDIRKNLPSQKGIEVKNNTAPMQRGLLIDEEGNNIGIVTKGLTQYEVSGKMLYIPILRASGIISNPHNPARTTPAGPPLEVEDLQQVGKNRAELNVFFGSDKAFDEVLKQVYNYIVV